MKYLRFAALLLVASLFIGACGSDDEAEPKAGSSPKAEDTGGTDTGGGPATFTAVDFGFQGPTSLPASTTKVTLKNDGKEPHMLVFIQLLDGKDFDFAKSYIEKQGVGGKPPPWAKDAGGVPPAKPGSTSTGQVKLEPGEYVIACFVTSKKEHKSHAELGMFQPLTVE